MFYHQKYDFHNVKKISNPARPLPLLVWQIAQKMFVFSRQSINLLGQLRTYGRFVGNGLDRSVRLNR